MRVTLTVMRLAVMLAFATRVAWAGSLPQAPGMVVAKTSAPLPIVDSKLAVTVRGPLAEVSVAQTFRNDDSEPTEATYIFPLPPDAAVTAMTIETGAREIHAAIARRADAEARYEDAIAKGVDAGLVEQARPDVFMQSVAAIAPHATVTVHLRYDTAARYRDGAWQLVVPLVVAPRYVPGSASGRPTVGAGAAPDTDRAPDASRVTPAASPGAGGATELAIAFDSAVDGVSSPTHELLREGDRYVIRDAHSDRDAIVRWHAKLPAQGWVESDGFAAVVVEAPPAPAKRPAARALFVFGRSATTAGDGELALRGLETAIVGALGPDDLAATERGDFGSAAQLRAALEHTAAHHRFDLTRVLSRLSPAKAPIVLVTDGLVADDAEAIAAARKLGVPIHVIGFGPAPNRSLLAAIAAVSGGTLRIAVVGDDLMAIARGVLADVATPPQPFAVTWGTLATSQLVPANQPRLGAGQAALVFARVATPKAANARAAGSVIALASMATPKAPAGATTSKGPIARMWARLVLDDLVAAGDPKAIADHALAYGLVSPETSMIAVGSEVTTAGGVRHTRAVPVSLPAGMRWQEIARNGTLSFDDEEVEKPTARHHHRDRDDDDRGADEDQDGVSDKKTERRNAPVAPPATATATAPSAADAGAENQRDIFSPDSIEAEVVSARSIDARRALRLAAALGGGVTVAHGATVGTGAVTARVDYGRTLLGGVEGSLWLVDGLHAQGELGIYAGYLWHRFELDGGPALHLGDGVGPAAAIALRAYLAHHVDLYLHEDLGLLFGGGTSFTQSTTSAGLELSW